MAAKVMSEKRILVLFEVRQARTPALPGNS
jgi:hypothetical protein